MKIDLKVILPYIVIIASLAMTWGMWSERLEAVEKKSRCSCTDATRHCYNQRKNYVDGILLNRR